MHSQPPKSPNSSNPPSPPYQGGMKGKHQGGSPSQAPILGILAQSSLTGGVAGGPWKLQEGYIGIKFKRHIVTDTIGIPLGVSDANNRV